MIKCGGANVAPHFLSQYGGAVFWEEKLKIHFSHETAFGKIRVKILGIDTL